jgi:hypothetical protein
MTLEGATIHDTVTGRTGRIISVTEHDLMVQWSGRNVAAVRPVAGRYHVTLP